MNPENIDWEVQHIKNFSALLFGWPGNMVFAGIAAAPELVQGFEAGYRSG